MIRFKVIRGSHLMLVLSAIILAAVLVFILLQELPAGTANVAENYEAKTRNVFASMPYEVQPLQIDIETEKNDEPPLANSPCILIYHTHTHEAYEQVDNAPYEALEVWRTADEQHNVVRVGAALADELTKQGYFVVHDTTDHEMDNIEYSYLNALETLESYSMKFDLVIDLHRDAYIEGLPLRLDDGDKSYAQIMLLIGMGDDYAAVDKPDYQRNLSFAHKLSNELNKDIPGIARNVIVKKARYNQHIGDIAALIEIGHNKNTLEEALNSIPCLADAIGKIL